MDSDIDDQSEGRGDQRRPDPLPLQNLEHINWSRRHVDSMADGGTWGVPRSGLLFVKTGPDSLALIVKAAPDEVGLPDEFRAFQDDDYRSIKAHMLVAGIEVTDRTERIDA